MEKKNKARKIVDPAKELGKATQQIELLKSQLNLSRTQNRVLGDMVNDYKVELKEFRDRQRKHQNDSLVAHGIISGKGKILTCCDGCRLNGNCKLQNIVKGHFADCTHPYPITEDDKIAIAKFPMDQVNYWDNEDLLN